jgi:hypothetical protein
MVNSDVGLFHGHMSFLSYLFIDGAQRRKAPRPRSSIAFNVDGFERCITVVGLWVTAMRLLFAQRSKQA